MGFIALALFVLQPTPPTRGQSVPETLLALFGNDEGGSVLVILQDSQQVMVIEKSMPDPTSYYVRDAVCSVNQAIVTVCGQYVYVAVDCQDIAPQLFIFPVYTTFPCDMRPLTIYLPLVYKEGWK